MASKEIQNIKKYGPLTTAEKKELTLEERQPVRFGKGILGNQQPDRMFRTQRKKKPVSGTMKGKQVDTTGAPNMSQVNKSDGKKLLKLLLKLLLNLKLLLLLRNSLKIQVLLTYEII
jgi:hypothetical protein